MAVAHLDLERPSKSGTFRVFIAASSRAAQVSRKLGDVLRSNQYDDFEPMHWHDSFSAGQFTLPRLLDIARTCDFAMFVFAPDDLREREDGQDDITRDNVVLEFGMFTAFNGSERSAIFMQDGVTLPSDTSGLTVETYPAPTDFERFDRTINECVARVVKSWRSTGPTRGDRGLGFATTLADEKAELDDAQRVLVDIMRNELPRGPIRINSGRGARSAYCEGLDSVTERFWTTTYLSSPFWTHSQSETPDIVAANANMLGRLRAVAGDGPLNARRLFLLDMSPEDWARRWRESLIHSRRLEGPTKLPALVNELRNLRDNINRMHEQGFEVRVVFDDDEGARSLLTELDGTKSDSELAVYDSRRIDLFDGGSIGQFLGLRSFCTGHAHFDGLLEIFEKYYCRLWEKSSPAIEFLVELERIRDHVQNRVIDYRPNWLASYEYDLRDEDRRLKERERDCVIKRLAKDERLSSAERILDIGSCTGRYPFELAEHVTTSEIWGVDSDQDCINFCRGKEEDRRAERRANAGDWPRMRWFQADFLDLEDDGDGFDIITCMLGTISHFGFDRDFNAPTRNDSLQRMLQKCSDLLTGGGILFIGSWSDEALAQRQLLSIYGEIDVDRLCRWTPKRDILRSRLEDVGLAATREDVDRRLDVWLCTKPG